MGKKRFRTRSRIKPYEKRSDIDKIKAQWTKLTGLHSREEYSAAALRCATAAEVAANFAIRAELKKAKLSIDAVNSFLEWANGLSGKMTRLVLWLSFGGKSTDEYKRLLTLAQKINRVRNSIIHQGAFLNEDEAQAVIDDAREFTESLVGRYKQGYAVPDSERKKT